MIYKSLGEQISMSVVIWCVLMSMLNVSTLWVIIVANVYKDTQEMDTTVQVPSQNK